MTHLPSYIPGLLPWLILSSSFRHIEHFFQTEQISLEVEELASLVETLIAAFGPFIQFLEHTITKLFGCFPVFDGIFDNNRAG